MINCIVAIERNQGIGFNGQMPWPHLKGDMAWFRKITTDCIVIMGSTTWKSIGSKPLPNRINIVLSRKNEYPSANHTFSDPDEALIFCKDNYLNKKIFIIGGDSIYKTYMDIVDTFYITEIDADYECDTFFDFSYVKKTCTSVIEHATINDPIKYTIREYNI